MVSEWRQETPTARGLIRHLSSGMLALFVVMIFAVLAGPAIADNELPFKVTDIIIELTDNDIELQVFVDGNEWKRLEIEDPKERKIFDLRTLRRLGKQGLSEILFASEPSDFPEDAPSEAANATVLAFLARFPAGDYEVEGMTTNGNELEGVATLTHILPALPEIVGPVSETDEPPIVDPNNTVIAWEPVTTQFLGSGDINIVGYQIIVEQVDPFRKLTIDLPASATSVSIQPEFLIPDTLYDFEVLAIEESGNATISVGEFVTSEP